MIIYVATTLMIPSSYTTWTEGEWQYMLPQHSWPPVGWNGPQWRIWERWTSPAPRLSSPAAAALPSASNQGFLKIPRGNSLWNFSSTKVFWEIFYEQSLLIQGALKKQEISDSFFSFFCLWLTKRQFHFHYKFPKRYLAGKPASDPLDEEPDP